MRSPHDILLRRSFHALLVLAGLAAGVPGAAVAGDPADGNWAAIPPPTGRYGHTAVYDPVRDRMVSFGGWDGFYRNDVWALSLSGTPAWTQQMPFGTPPDMRGGHTAIYDSARDRIIVFGGVDDLYVPQNDVWALSLSGTPVWTQLTPTGTPPSARHWHTAIYDVTRDRMIVFGGGLGNDVWSLTLSGTPAWTHLTPTGVPPSGRGAHTAIYDAPRDRMIVFGGSDGSNRNDVWSLGLAGSTSWTLLSPSGTKPSARSYHSAIFDPVRNRMVVFGGYDGSPRNDVWAMSLTGSPAWSALAPTGTKPVGQHEHTSIYDPVRDRMVAFGSATTSDVWGLSLAGTPAWVPLVPSGAPPSARLDHAAIYDSPRDRMIVFGGSDGTPRNDVRALALAGSPTWTLIAPTGTAPSARTGHTALYDPVRQRMVVFGTGDVLRNDVWVLALSGSPIWTQLTPTGTPPSPRTQHSAVYDIQRDRIIMFGGYDGTLQNDVWALTLSGTPAWTQLAPAGAPPSGRQEHTAIYDATRDRMVVFGGVEGIYLNDVWELELSGAAWNELNPQGTPPVARHAHTAVYDAGRDRMVVFGGYDGAFKNDVWALGLSGTTSWIERIPGGALPSPQSGHTAIYDPSRDRMAIFGMLDGELVSTLSWGLTNAVGDDVAAGSGIELAPPRPNPARTSVTLEFTLPAPADLSIKVYDVVGRVVRHVAGGRFTGGRHAIVWDRRDASGRAVDSGIYFVRLESSGGHARVQKSILVR